LLLVNNPVRVMIQRRIIKWIKGVTRITPKDRVLEIGCSRGAGARLIQAEFRPVYADWFHQESLGLAEGRGQPGQGA
jgi:hypothetical protein